MNFGGFFRLPCAPWQSKCERYGDTLAQIKHGDHLGFDTAWLAELHFFPEFSVMSSPLIMAAAAAQHMQRIRLGMAVSLLPLNDPIRSAEDAATVDILRACLKTCHTSETTHHQVDHGHTDHGFARVSQIFIIFG
jgi:hypothetical protein